MRLSKANPLATVTVERPLPPRGDTRFVYEAEVERWAYRKDTAIDHALYAFRQDACRALMERLMAICEPVKVTDPFKSGEFYRIEIDIADRGRSERMASVARSEGAAAGRAAGRKLEAARVPYGVEPDCFYE